MKTVAATAGGLLSRDCDRRRFRGAAVGVLLLIACHVLAAVGHAQDDDFPVDENLPAVEARQIIVNGGVIQRVQVIQQNGERIRVVRVGPVNRLANQDQINIQVFRNTFDLESNREDLKKQLQRRVDEIDVACELSEEQQQKLTLAGTGDITRFFDQLEDLREEYGAVGDDRAEKLNVMREAAVLRRRFERGLFSEESLFAKSLGRTLSAEQNATLGDWTTSRARAKFQAQVESAVADLERRAPLNDFQREQLISCITAAWKPPLKTGKYDYYLVWYYAAQVPRATFELILDDAQMQVVDKRIAVGKRMAPRLKKENYID